MKRLGPTAAPACFVTRSCSLEGCSCSKLLPNPIAPEDTSTTCRPPFINRPIELAIGSIRSVHSSPSDPVTVVVPTLTTTRRAARNRFSRSSFSLWFSSCIEHSAKALRGNTIRLHSHYSPNKQGRHAAAGCLQLSRHPHSRKEGRRASFLL